MGEISVELVKSFLLSLIPIFVGCCTGYVLARQKILTQEHGAALSVYIFWVGLPALIFRRISLLDLHDLDGPLLAADFISKMIPLIVMLLWWAFAKNGSIDWVITIFGLVSLPNTVLVGDSILQPMYGKAIAAKTTTIIFAQSLYWYNFLIIMHEIRGALIERQKEIDAEKDGKETSKKDDPEKCESGVLEVFLDQLAHQLSLSNATQSPRHGHSVASADGLEFASGTSRSLARTSASNFNAGRWSPMAMSHTPGISRRPSLNFDMARISTSSRPSVDAGFYMGPPQPEKLVITRDSLQKALQAPFDEKSIDISQVVGELGAQVGEPVKQNFTYKIIIRILKNTLTWASLLSLLYSFVATKFNLTMPYYVVDTLTLLGNGTIVLGMILLGMAAGHQNTVLLCSVKEMIAGWGLRFLLAPITMAVGSFAVGIKGQLLRYAIVQTVVPQGGMVYAFALQYQFHQGIIATAVLTQMVVFIPCILGLYSVLEAF